ncbi:MAG TPA: tetratricopeptide repeat protein [Tepidisphaeraceae bacterium]|jgi:Tfp pilus assembly protein PilF
MRRDWTISIVLAAITLIIYIRAATFSFISYDDPDYVSANAHVQRGITPGNIKWAFTTATAANWHPITWLSHMLDWHVFGADAGKHHLVSVLLHAINAVLMFWVWNRLTADPWRSAVVAALFAWHPLHVESVAWIAERKDVLSTFFMLLAILAYERFVRAHRWSCYGTVVCCFALGLMAKPMVITLPLLLILLDFWPLRQTDWRRAVTQKIPLLLIALAAGAVTFLVQRAGGAVASIEKIPITLRLSNAIISYVRYLGKTLWPAKVAVFYPMPTAFPLWEVILALLFLIAMTLVAFTLRRSRPWLMIGWLWYLIMLLPVIGVIQVGEQAMADRYTYVSLVGIFVMIAWSIPAKAPLATSVASTVVLALLAAATTRQLGYWRNSETLFRHATQATENNWLAHNHLATALADERRLDEALESAQTAVAIHPSATTHFNLANLLRRAGNLPDACIYYERALQLNPQLTQARNNYGIALAQSAKLPQAEAQLRAAIQLKPDYADAWANLGLVLRDQGKLPAAQDALQRALAIDRQHPIARKALHSLSQ